MLKWAKLQPFNGQGGEYFVELVDVAKKSATVRINSFNPSNRTPKFKALLGQVMSKGDRMDYAIQKAVELGVSEIQLLTSERCEMRLKYDRDQKSWITGKVWRLQPVNNVV